MTTNDEKRILQDGNKIQENQGNTTSKTSEKLRKLVEEDEKIKKEKFFFTKLVSLRKVKLFYK